jgi:hypothetical protein
VLRVLAVLAALSRTTDFSVVTARRGALPSLVLQVLVGLGPVVVSKLGIYPTVLEIIHDAALKRPPLPSAALSLQRHSLPAASYYDGEQPDGRS